MYSEIISAEDYVRIMSQHVYMQQADELVAATAVWWARRFSGAAATSMLDMGCGPGRITKLLWQQRDIGVCGIDIDGTFLSYARGDMPDTMFIEADALTYKHPYQVPVIVSHGLDHHIAPEYLSRVHSNLQTGGVYVVGDEFLPYYETNEERKKRAVVWYAHVISHATYHHHAYLAQEEAKTLLDDLAYGNITDRKNAKQIEAVLSSAIDIDEAVKAQHWSMVNDMANGLLQRLHACVSEDVEVDATISLSRGDYKVCHAEFAKKVEQYGFKVASVQTIGPVNAVGGFGVYVLLKV